MDCQFHSALASSGSKSSTAELKACTCKDSQHIIESSASASASNKVTAAEQNEETTSAAELYFKITLNDDQDINLIEKSDVEIMSTTNGVGAGSEGAVLSGDPRRLSVPPSLATNQDAADLVDMVDDLLKDLTVTFSSVCKEVFEKLDDMAARIDAMEARALAAVAADEAQETAPKNAEAK